MEPRPPESLKTLARSVAEKLWREGGYRPNPRTLRRLRAFAVRHPPPRFDGAPEDEDVLLGVWECGTEVGRLAWRRRKEDWHDWPLWADATRIPPRGSRARVVLLGESVARGFLMDPYLTATKALEQAAGFEVVDLAKTDLTLRELKRLLRRCLLLEPRAGVASLLR